MRFNYAKTAHVKTMMLPQHLAEARIAMAESVDQTTTLA